MFKKYTQHIILTVGYFTECTKYSLMLKSSEVSRKLAQGIKWGNCNLWFLKHFSQKCQQREIRNEVSYNEKSDKLLKYSLCLLHKMKESYFPTCEAHSKKQCTFSFLWKFENRIVFVLCSFLIWKKNMRNISIFQAHSLFPLLLHLFLRVGLLRFGLLIVFFATGDRSFLL